MEQRTKNRIRAFALVMTLVLSTAFLCGARKPDTKYFSIYHDTYHITVTESMLRGSWYHATKRAEFVKGQGIYERAASVDITQHQTALKAMEQLPEILQIAARFEQKINTAAYDGHINFNPNYTPKFWVTGARDGSKVDMESLCCQIFKVLKTRKYADIAVPIKSVPHKSEQVVLASVGLRSSYTTRFNGSSQNRANNIALALNAYNGLTVFSGERIGFNAVVGPRTRERGYEEANIIIDGEFVQGVGGGVCQASTTVFNAVLLAGMKIVESHNHSLAIGYVPLGRDAMVTSASDLVFENDTGATIYIEAFAERGVATVRVYGRPSKNIRHKPKTSVKTFSVKEETEGAVPADLVTNPDDYEKIVVERGIPAREVLTHLEIYKGERLLQKKLIRRSRYKGKPQIVRWQKKAVELLPVSNADEIDIRLPESRMRILSGQNTV